MRRSFLLLSLSLFTLLSTLCHPASPFSQASFEFPLRPFLPLPPLSPFLRHLSPVAAELQLESDVRLCALTAE